jgi:peptidoglycan LD-endopeptidase CwlK
MPQYSNTSKARLASCHPKLQAVFNEVIKERDCIIICGARTQAEQQKAFAGGFSKIDGVSKRSMHQIGSDRPKSLAVDVLPYPLNWNDVKGHTEFARFVLATAQRLGVNLVWGGNWKTFKDRPHYELAPASNARA